MESYKKASIWENYADLVSLNEVNQDKENTSLLGTYKAIRDSNGELVVLKIIQLKKDENLSMVDTFLNILSEMNLKKKC